MAFPTVIIDTKLCCPANAGFEDDMVYVGSGRDTSVRPSPWASPFGCSSCHNNFGTTPLDDSSFLRYASSRADLLTWLAPLIGKRLVCGCNNKKNHIEVIAELIMTTFDACALQPSQEKHPVQMYDSSNPCSNVVHPETIFGMDNLDWDSLPMDPQHPCVVPWPDVWHFLVDEIRRSSALKFWDLFSGPAQLTRAFSKDGWICGAPVDVYWSEHFNLLNPLFVAIVVGLILEGRFQLISLSPPFNCTRDTGKGLFTVCNNLVTACVKSDCHVLFFMPDGAKEWGMAHCPLASAQLTHTALVDTCLFGSYQCSRNRFISTSIAVETLTSTCCGGHIGPNANSYNAINFSIWPELAYRIAKTFNSLLFI
jgi:hypothetical protein